MSKQKAIAKLNFQLSSFFIIYCLFLSIASAAQIKIAWDPNPPEDAVIGYKACYGTSATNINVCEEVGNFTEYIIENLIPGQKYFIAVKAYNNYGESGFSNIVETPFYTIDTNPSGLQIIADNVVYNSPQTFSWDTWRVGSSHTISVSSPQSGTSGTRYVYSSWNDGGAQSHTITAPSVSTTFTANFTTQYSLTTSVSPSGGGSVSPAGTNWYNSGQSVQVTATPSSGYAFSGWSGDITGSTNPATITINGPKSIKANFVVAGTFSVSPASGLTSTGNQGGPFSPSSQTYTLQNTGGAAINWTVTKTASWITLSATSGTLAAGASTTITVSINSNANNLSPGTYTDIIVFTNSTNSIGNTTRSVSLTVNNQPQGYTVSTNPPGLQITVDGENYVSPQTFNWAIGSIHTISVSSPQYGESGIRYVFSSWNDGGSRTHNITATTSMTTYIANFTTQFSLTTSVSPSGGGTVSPSGTNWYNSGRNVTITATANSGYAFTGWSGDLTGSTNPTTVTMDRPKSITAQFATTSEVISTPAIPSGPPTGNIGISYTYIASGASSNLGHSLQYQFDWKGDSSDLSSWGAANQQKVWEYAGTYYVRVRARCATHTSVVSNWSAPLQVTIQGDYQVSCGDGRIPCVERVDGGDDSNNLVNGKPKGDVEFEFKIKVYDAGGSPQYVRILTTQRTNPIPEDFYIYDMTCSGQFPAGAECRYKTILGPAAIHKFYFEVMMSNGTVIRYPSSGYITGPEIHLLNGNNLVGVPRNIVNAQLNGQEAFGSTKVYRWNGELNAYTEVSHSDPVKLGEGYSLYRQNDNLLELSEYADYQYLEFIYLLKPGFNLISNPYNGNVNLSDMKIKKGNNSPISWQEAVARGWIVDALYYFNGKDWGNTYSYKTSQNGAVMVPWVGYWLILNVNDDNYYLIVTRP